MKDATVREHWQDVSNTDVDETLLSYDHDASVALRRLVVVGDVYHWGIAMLNFILGTFKSIAEEARSVSRLLAEKGRAGVPEKRESDGHSETGWFLPY